jgi:hypothetical protein
MNTTMDVFFIFHILVIPVNLQFSKFSKAVPKTRQFGALIFRLVMKEHLTREEAFTVILLNDTNPIQQGAFLAALTAKGETTEEIAGCRDAIYQCDTIKSSPCVNDQLWKTAGPGWIHMKPLIPVLWHQLLLLRMMVFTLRDMVYVQFPGSTERLR